ncbi:MAG: hypothetical protein HC845_06250 [Akkermansiaceae bacterium]|nr:hypothetical protein [Akkermansiaceae bacterium]
MKRGTILDWKIHGADFSLAATSDRHHGIRYISSGNAFDHGRGMAYTTGTF